MASPPITDFAAAIRQIAGVLVTGITQVQAHLPSPPGTTVLGTVGLQAGPQTITAVFPPGKVTRPPSIGTLPTQVDVMRRYPDGSIRTAVLTAVALAPGVYQIVAIPIDPPSPQVLLQPSGGPQIALQASTPIEEI